MQVLIYMCKKIVLSIRKYSKLLFASVCLAGFLCGVSQASPLASLSKKLMSIKTLSANFTQTVKANGRTLSTSQGSMILKRPGQFYWKVTSPQKQLLIVNHDLVTYFQPDLQQVTIRHFSGNVGNTPAAFLLNSSAALLGKNYNIKRQGDRFSLTPKNQKNLVQSVNLTFDGDDISEIILNDHLGHHTQIQLSDVDINDDVDSSVFSFTPPKGVGVVRE